MRYVRPDTVDEAAELLTSSRGMILAGGTDLCVYMAEGVRRPEALIDIGGIEAMRGIRIVKGDRDEERIRIGACTTLAEVAASDALPACLRQGARAVGSPQIRNLGTIGGNVCNASPCGDTLAPLLSLDARFALRSSGGARVVPSGDFFTGPKQTVLRPDEILEFIELSASARRKASAFRMIGNRRGQAISQTNASVCVTARAGRVSDVRIAVGSVAPIPLRLKKLEAFLNGRRIEEVSPADLREPILAEIRPIDDVRSSARYRQEVTVSLVFDALAACTQETSRKGEGAGA